MLRKKIISFVVMTLFCCLISNNIFGGEKLKVVTSTSFLADWVCQIGKEFVEVEFINDGKIDMHFFEPRPGDVIKCSRADLFVTAGLDLDIWLQPLLDASRNSKIQYGAQGYIDASVGVYVLQKPTGSIDMSMGDIHPYGNPHYFYGLENVRIALENIVEGLAKVDPINRDAFKINKEQYWTEVQNTFRTLKKIMDPFKGTKVITYHLSWEYFVKEFGFEIVGYFEPKPGIPPTPKDIKNLIDIINSNQVKLILKEPYYPRRRVKKVAKETGAKMLELTNLPGGRDNATTYLENLKANVNDLIKALREN